MKMEHRREATNAGRENLMRSLSSLQIANSFLEEAARDADKSTLLRIGVSWEKSVAQAQAAKKLCDELLDEEVQTWIEKS